MKLRFLGRIRDRATNFLRAAVLQIVPPALLGAFAATWLDALTGIGFSTAFVLTLIACAILFVAALARS